MLTIGYFFIGIVLFEMIVMIMLMIISIAKDVLK